MAKLRVFKLSAVYAAFLFSGCRQEDKSIAQRPTSSQSRLKPRATRGKSAEVVVGMRPSVDSVSKRGPNAAKVEADRIRAERHTLALETLNAIRVETEGLANDNPAPADEPLSPELIEQGGEVVGEVQVSGLSVSDGNEDSSNVLPARAEDYEGDKDVMIKYSSNCLAQTELNVLIKNYAVMSLVDAIEAHRAEKDEEAIAFGPSPLYLSGHGEMGPSMSSRGLSFENPAQCVGADMRYMIMESAGLSLHKFTLLRGDSMSLLEALTVGRNLLESIFALHAYGLVHGDITWRNVLFAQRDAANLPAPIGSKLVLVDWDQARLMQDDKTTTALKQGKSPAQFLTPTELREGPKYLPTYYDDLYRVYELMGALMGGKNFYTESGLITAAAAAGVSTKKPTADAADSNPLIKLKTETNWISKNAAKFSTKFTADKDVKKALDEFHAIVHRTNPATKNLEPADTQALELLDTMINFFA